MVIVMETHATGAQVFEVESLLKNAELEVHRSDGADRTVLGVVGDVSRLDIGRTALLPGVRDVMKISSPYKLASREFQAEDTVVYAGDVPIGGKEVILIGGPCAVETAEQIHSTAQFVASAGARILRGGAFKPRTSPYSFQGLGEEGLQLLRQAADANGLAVVTEVMSLDQVDVVADHADLLQVGARNMQNYNLLTTLGETDKPVLLKRGPSATVEDLLMSAEYVLSTGNPNVVLCERGIRTFETATRNTLDLSAVPVIKHLSHLPVIVDPSHGVGKCEYVAAMARGAVAVGADGVMVEVHPEPGRARCDGSQSLRFDQFANLTNRCRVIGTTLGRKVAKGHPNG